MKNALGSLGWALGAWVAFAMVGPRDAWAAPPTIHHFTASLSELNKITLDWRVSGGDPSNLLYIYEDVGFRLQSCPATQPSGCSTSFRVENPGVYRYTLSVRNGSEFANQTVEVTVDSPAAPTFPRYETAVDLLAVEDQRIDLEDRPGSGFFQLTQGGSILPSPTPYPPGGTIPISASELVRGKNDYTLKFCESFAPGSTPLCSTATPLRFNVRPDPLDGPYRRFENPAAPISFRWQPGIANVWNLAIYPVPRDAAAPAAFATWTGQPFHTLPANALAPGVYDVELTSCSFSAAGATCSNRLDVHTPTAGVLTILAANVPVSQGDVVATVAPAGGGNPVELVAPASGTALPLAQDGSSVASGALVAAIITNDVSVQQLVVGGTRVAWQERPFYQDFSAETFDTWMLRPTGDPLDIVIASDGDIWQIGEFSSAVAHASGASVTRHDTPLTRVFNAETGLYEKVTPHRSNFGGRKTISSSLGERVIDTGDAIWFTHGGGLFPNADENYGQLIRFDRTAADDPATPDDDRLCAIHLPGDDREVVGVAHDGERVWFAELRPDESGGAISWFLDNGQIGCDNDLDYGDPAAVAAASADNACATSTHPDGCIHEIALPAGARLATHLAVDPSTGDVWFVLLSGGGQIGRVSPNGGSPEVFPLPAPVRPSLFGGFPFQIRADDDAVYVGEYSDSQLLRFDKAQAQASDCTTLTADKTNPCITELTLPIEIPEVRQHSIDLEGGRLWFTLANEGGSPDAQTASTFGYVDVASWAAGVPTGVLYTDLEGFGTPRPGDRHSFRGIDVAPDGSVALADMHFDELVRLTPRD